MVPPPPRETGPQGPGGAVGPGGAGPVVLALHETAADSMVWSGLAGALGEGTRLLAPDRRGWGADGAPEDYRRTTVGEHSEDAARLIEEQGLAGSGAGAEAGAIVVGAGFGAVCALDLLLRRPELARACVAIEPPLLALVPEATEGVSADTSLLREAISSEGPAAAAGLHLAGALTTLGAGGGRPGGLGLEAARERAVALIAELAAVPAWPIPYERLRELEGELVVATSPATPPILGRAADALCAIAPAAARAELGAADDAEPAHLADPQGLALTISALAGSKP